MKAWFKELVQHPVNGIGDGWPQAISYLPVDSRSFNELQPRKHASPPEDVLAESEENSGLIRKQSPPPPLLLTPFPSVRDLGGPDLALERDHEGRPDERGNACPAPTRLRRPQGLEDPAPHLLIPTQDVLDGARVLAGKTTAALKVPGVAPGMLRRDVEGTSMTVWAAAAAVTLGRACIVPHSS